MYWGHGSPQLEVDMPIIEKVQIDRLIEEADQVDYWQVEVYAGPGPALGMLLAVVLVEPVDMQDQDDLEGWLRDGVLRTLRESEAHTVALRTEPYENLHTLRVHAVGIVNEYTTVCYGLDLG